MMDWALLKEIATEQGPNTMRYLGEPVLVPAGQIERRTLKKKLIDVDKYDEVRAELGALFDDPDFVQIDMGDPTMVKIVERLVVKNVLTPAEGDAMRALSEKHVPRWESLGFSQLPQRGDVEAALRT
jgi:hypothetical protein